MADISIQFHATPDELVSFLRSAASETGAQITTMRLSPPRRTRVSEETLDASCLLNAFEVALTTREPDTGDDRDFYESNPLALRLILPRETPEGWRQGHLSARIINDDDALLAWRQVARGLRRVTNAGAMVVNPSTGARAWAREFRHTQGARALELSGATMLPFAGSNVITFRADPPA